MGLKAVAGLDNQTFASPTFTGSAGFANGTVAVPSIAWTSDADGSGTGFYRNSANSIDVALDGVRSAAFAGGYVYTVTAFSIGLSGDCLLTRVGSNQSRFSSSGGTDVSRSEINKAVTAFSNAVAKTVFTLTIPNAAHSASYLVRITGSLGAGGAIGANEASATNCYVVTLTRTAGVNAVAAISAAFGAAAAAVAGAATVTCTAALAAVSGAVGAVNTIDIQATISRAAGTSDNHTCVATASLINANATGITIA